MDNYSLVNCTKNFMTFCAKFLLTRKIICAILEPLRATKGNKRTGESRKGKKKNDHYRNERIPFGRAGRREEKNAHEQRKSLLLYIHDL